MAWSMWIIMIFVLGVIFTVAYLIHFRFSTAKKEELTKTVNIVGGIVAAFSLLWAAYTYDNSNRLQKELSAYTIYAQHQQTSISNPQFLGHSYFALMTPPNEGSSDEDKKKYEQYQWYVGHALFSFEPILEIFPDDKGWKDTFKGFIESHQNYIRSNEFPCNHHSESIKKLIKETIGKECPKEP